VFELSSEYFIVEVVIAEATIERPKDHALAIRQSYPPKSVPAKPKPYSVLSSARLTMLIVPTPPEAPTCQPAAGFGNQSSRSPICANAASAFDEADTDRSEGIIVFPSKGPPLNVADALIACSVPARTTPRPILAPMAMTDVEPRPFIDALPSGPSPVIPT